MLDDFIGGRSGFEDTKYAVLYPSGLLWFEIREPAKVAIFSGSFNPLHQGHRMIAEAARVYLKRPVYYEITIDNADKGEVLADDLSRRLDLFNHLDDVVVLTRARLFVDKARLFPGTTFVVGYDTAARIVDPRYGDVDEILSEIYFKGCRFLVAARVWNGETRTLDDIDVPGSWNFMFEQIPAHLYGGTDHRSSLLR